MHVFCQIWSQQCHVEPVLKVWYSSTGQFGCTLVHVPGFLFEFLSDSLRNQTCAVRDGSLRLADSSSGPGYEYGRLEIFIRGFWSTVCDAGGKGFTPDSARVACRILGFGGGRAEVPLPA